MGSLSARRDTPVTGIQANGEGGVPRLLKAVQGAGRNFVPDYSATASPEPPNSLGKSLSLGRPSFMRSTVSA